MGEHPSKTANGVTRDAVDPEALALLRTDPDAYVRATRRALPSENVDEGTIERLVEEAENGVAEEKLRRPPSLGTDASGMYSMTLPDDLMALVDERAALQDRTRSELVCEALVDYLTR